MKHSVQAYIQRLDTALLEHFLKQDQKDQCQQMCGLIEAELRRRMQRTQKTKPGERRPQCGDRKR